jgi:protein CpxP
MKKKLIYTFIFVLIGINLWQLYHNMIQNRRVPKHPRELIIERLKFDQAQIKKYDGMIQNHRTQLNKFDKKLQFTKSQLNLQLVEPNVDTMKRDSLLLEISSIIQQIERIHFDHFLEIKSLCKDRQIADYKLLAKEFSKIFHPKPLKKKAM